MLLVVLAFSSEVRSSEDPVIPQKVFTKSEIQRLAGVYIENNLEPFPRAWPPLVKQRIPRRAAFPQAGPASR